MLFDGERVAELPASLDGMYLSGAGRGAFWPAGEIRGADAGRHEVTVRAADPGGLAGTLDARRLVWLGDVDRLADRPPPRTVPLADACGRYVDHYAYDRKGGRLMPHFGTPDEAASPVLGGETRERAPEVAQLVFVGGTGRSGTHVLSQLISRHNRYGLVPVEVRFHTDPDGFPGLLAGEVTPEQFVKRLRGFWWRGFQTRRFRGMYRFVDRDRFDAAVARFEADHDDLEAACRRLFYDLLWFRVDEGVREGEENPRGEALVEQSTDTVAAAPTLARLFPEARFIHVVRDGRDASASRVAQTRGLVRPRTRVQGIEWWEERIGAIERGADAIGDGPPADREPRRARAHAARPGGAAAAVPLPRRPGDQAHPALLLEPDDDRGGEQGALARRASPSARPSAIDEPLPRGARAPGGRRRALRAAAAPLARAQRRRPRPAGLRLRSRADPMTETPAELVFVGGTGRSGTHVLSYLLDRHSRFHGVPIECRFHCNPKGLASVVKGETDAGGLPAQAARLLVAPGADRRPRLRAGEVAGARPRARARPVLDRRAGPLRGRGRTVRARLMATTSSAPRAPSSTTCCSRSPTRPASRCWSR